VSSKSVHIELSSSQIPTEVEVIENTPIYAKLYLKDNNGKFQISPAKISIKKLYKGDLKVWVSFTNPQPGANDFH